MSVDPLFKSYPWYTPYQFAGNKPIQALDLDGLEELDYRLFQIAMIKGEESLRLIQFPNTRSNRRRLNTSVNPNIREGSPKELIVNEGVAPSEAVQEFTDNPQDFTMDCGTFCQALILTGMNESIVGETFDEFMTGQIASARDGNEMRIRNHLSTGLDLKNEWLSFGGKFVMNEDLVTKKADKVIEDASIGTIVNLQSNFLGQSVFRNENLVKVGDDEFVAQGLGSGVLSMDEIKTALVDKAVQGGMIENSNRSKKQARKSIFVKQVIEHTFQVTTNN